MAQYTAYTDTNGIKWTIITSANGMIATVLDETEPKYIPPATDLIQPILTDDGTEMGRVEAERKAFQGLREKMDAFAKEHVQGTGLTVKAHAPIPWWVWAGGAYLLLRKRR